MRVGVPKSTNKETEAQEPGLSRSICLVTLPAGLIPANREAFTKQGVRVWEKEG